MSTRGALKGAPVGALRRGPSTTGFSARVRDGGPLAIGGPPSSGTDEGGPSIPRAPHQPRGTPGSLSL